MSNRYIYNIGTRVMVWLALCCWQGCTTSDSDDSQQPQVVNGRVAVDLELSVSTTAGSSSAITRMAAETVQAGGVFRGIKNLRAYALDGNETVLDLFTNLRREPQDNSTYHYFSESIDLSIGTNRFVCYAQADCESTAPKWQNGAITATFDATDLSKNRFEPVQMVTQAKIDLVDDPTSPYAVAKKLAKYLTDIAKATGWSSSSYKLGAYYKAFINDGNLIAGSTENIRALVKELKENITGLEDSDTKTAILTAIGDNVDDKITATGGIYPANIGLPDGAASMKWTTGTAEEGYPKFVPQIKAPENSPMPLTDHDRVVYPPELYYFVNSSIKTSESHRKGDYVNTNWTDVLATYSADDATVSSTTRSVAVKDALDYAVGCMAVTVYTETATLEDNSKDPVTPVTINNGTKHFFPLTGIQIDGQYIQTHEFLPMQDVKTENTTVKQREFIIYDKVPFDKNSTSDNIYLTKATTTSQIADLKINYTLAFQSRDGKPIDIVLEFLNDSPSLFYGYNNGVVYPGTKFYLIGQIWPPNIEAPTTTKECRVFTKDYMSTVRLNIKSLKNAYNVIPDLKTAQYAIKVSDVAIKDWDDGGSQNNELYNW